MDFEFFGFSDPGKVRTHNEDSYLCNEQERLFLVADGMGGHASGDMASQLAVSKIEEFVKLSGSTEVMWPKPYREDLTLEQNRLLSSVFFANSQIRDVAEKNPEMDGMGTTLTGVLIEQDDCIAVVNIGDSRLYCIREGKIEQLTRDHTLVGEQERKGVLSRDEARKHPQRHILTRALGTSENPKTDLFRYTFMAEDMYLICSDGLHGMLEDVEILETIHSIKDKSLYKIGLSLILKANLAGGLDNITVVLLSF